MRTTQALGQVLAASGSVASAPPALRRAESFSIGNEDELSDLLTHNGHAAVVAAPALKAARVPGGLQTQRELVCVCVWCLSVSMDTYTHI